MRPLRLAIALSLLLSSAAPLAVSAQESATLVADSLQIAGDARLIAQGSVEVFYQGRRLTASRIVYDQSADRLLIEGPIRLTDETGTITVVAAQADLAADLTEGILQSARVVLDQKLQMAAAEMRRSGGRYLQLDNAVASSCRICAGSTTPLWEIRARRVLHDQQERQIYFDQAQLRVGGMPVLFIPRLRIPDPTLDRSSGFLMPEYTSRSGLGFGVTVPYFLTLGPSRDLTFSPSIMANGRSLGLRYRQAWDNGGITVTGALSRDEIQPGEMRGYVIADGLFALPNDFRLAFHAEAVSDDAYLADYGISDQDRIANSVQVERVRRDEYIKGRVVNFDTLRANELPSATPYLVTDATYISRFTLGRLGGEGTLRFGAHTHTREASVVTDSPLDADDIAEGADMNRLTIGADWRRDWVMPGGILGAVIGDIRIDSYTISDDVTYAGQTTRTLAGGAVEFRWPWVRSGANGVTQVIEPVAQLVWSSEGAGGAIPNEDSRLAEFDEANLFSMNRFPGVDAVETGFRANLGVSWTRIDPDGWTLGATVGRVFREAPVTTFSTASGLGGVTSDWLLALTAETADGLSLAGRVIAASDLSVTRGEMHAAYESDRFTVNSGYIWSIADPAEGRPDRVSDLVLGGSYQITPWWQTSASGRYDLEGDSYRSADFGLTYRNECLNVDLSLSRRFTTSTSVRPGTTVDLSVELLGFGGGTAAGPARMCRQ